MCSIYQNVQYFIRSKKCVLNLPQLGIVCTSAVISWHYAKNDNSPLKCHLFSRVFEFIEARKTCRWVVRTSMWLISYSGELCNKNCIVKTSETLITWNASCNTVGSGRWDAIKRVPNRLLKRAGMVFRIHSGQVELMLTNWCSYSAMIVNFEGIMCNNRTSCLTSSNVMHWYFRCSIVSLNLCKEYWNMAIFRITVLLMIKSSTFWSIDRLPASSHTGVMYY